MPEKRFFFGLALVAIVGAVLFRDNLIQTTTTTPAVAEEEKKYTPTPPIQLRAILHYATSESVPQLTLSEITSVFRVLQGGPSNLLLFGLGRDSLMWASLNPHSTTLFLEDNPDWVQTVHRDAPEIRAHMVQYRTRVFEADELMASYRSVPTCLPSGAYLRGNERCKLALHDLHDEVYDREWDVVLIDAPKGYFPEAPGRMSAIFSAAVVARNRKGSGATHVFVHNVDRMEERVYSDEFLCRKNLVGVVGKLGHFEVPPAANATRDDDGDGDVGDRFC